MEKSALKRLKKIEEDIGNIKERNRRVELDKAWETSKIRIMTIAIMTYTVIVLFFYIIKIPYPFLNALVPTIGFMLSTLTLPFIRKWWIKRLSR